MGAVGTEYAPVVEPAPLGPKAPSCNSTVATRGCAFSGRALKTTPQKFSLAYIEFDDVGELWSIGDQRKQRTPTESLAGKSQLEQALQVVATSKKQSTETGRPLLVLGFVHGWQNNASPSDESKQKNLRSFKDSLQFLSSDPNCPNRIGDNCPIVVGIFFAWRGRSSIDKNIFTYWSRRDAANRVGGASMTEAVMLLALASKGTPQPYDQANRCQQPDADDPDMQNTGPTTRFILVGHSFGGRALEHGVAQPMLTLLLERKAQAQACVAQWNAEHPDPGAKIEVQIHPPVDLIALINPANDAFEAKSLIEAFKRAGLEDQQFHNPLIVSLKSEGDWATGKLMRIAQSLSRYQLTMHSYTKQTEDESVPSICEQGELGLKAQPFYYRRSPGGILNMGSHYVDPKPVTKSESDLPVKDLESCSALNASAPDDTLYFWSDNSQGTGCYRLVSATKVLALGSPYSNEVRQSFYSCSRSLMAVPADQPVPTWNNTPYYVIDVPSRIIKNHDDIFQQGLFNMLTAIIVKSDRQPTQLKSIRVTPTPATVP